jgi:hypothetical protein
MIEDLFAESTVADTAGAAAEIFDTSRCEPFLLTIFVPTNGQEG